METLEYRVLGVSGGQWCIEQEGYQTLKEARAWAKSRRGPYRISRVGAEVVEEGHLWQSA